MTSKVSIIAAVAASAQSCKSSIVAGQVNVLIDGKTELWSVISAQAGGLVVGSNGDFVVNHNYRGYLVEGCPQTFQAAMYASRFPMLSTTLNFTVDLSSVGCGCNAAFYAVAMPAYNSNNQPDPTSCGDFYCDANNVCGVYCPEMDIMEANTAALQVTPHKCDAPQGQFYPSCDHGGCGLNTYKAGGPSMYGPGPAFTIDTTKPFTVSTAFNNSTSGLDGVVTTLTQPGGRIAALSHNDATCGKGYLESLTTAMGAGLVPTFSVWGDKASTMSWLDIPPCSASTDCDGTATSMTISDVSLTTV